MSDYSPIANLIGELATWQSERPDKLGEALADKHLLIVREATKKLKTEKPKKPESAPPKVQG